MEIRPACHREWIGEDAWFGVWINSPIPCCFPANSLVVSNSPLFMRFRLGKQIPWFFPC